MKFGTIKNGKFQEIKVAEIKEPLWESEAERESEWKLDFTNPMEFEVMVPSPENLFKAIGADFGDFEKAVKDEFKRQAVLVFAGTDRKARPHKKKRIAKKWAKQGRFKTRRTRLFFTDLQETRDGDTVEITFTKGGEK